MHMVAGESRTDAMARAVVLVAGFVMSLGCDRLSQPAERPEPSVEPASSAKLGVIAIHQPPDSFAIATGLLDEQGRPITANCGTCHATRPPNPRLRIGDSLEMFHQGVRGKHGNLSCISCHHPDDGYRSLRLADGSQVRRSDVMTLCAQCHGPQYRDYQRGAHGGMVGYWDLAKGSRERNNCIDCHRPHAPAYPTVQPAPGPNDRFLKGTGHE